MYNTIAETNQEIAVLEEEKQYYTNYWFTLGETDRDFDLKPQHSDNYWYMLGYNDRSAHAQRAYRDHQIEIGIKLEPAIEHF